MPNIIDITTKLYDKASNSNSSILLSHILDMNRPIIDGVPIIFIDSDRYAGCYSNYEYIMYNDNDWHDMDINSDDIGCRIFWNEYNHSKEIGNDVLEQYGVTSDLCGIPNLNINISEHIREWTKVAFPNNNIFLFICGSEHYYFSEALNSLITKDPEAKHCLIDINSTNDDINNKIKSLF